jgi:secreted trypsin-like serine protease
MSVLTASLLWIGLLSVPAQAVTNGQLVPDPKSSAPYVVSIWTTTDSNDYKDAEFLCTGTLISPQVVLTAAHCTTYTTPYFVKVGAESLNDQTAFTQVSAVWTSPRYNPKTFVNDVGLLKLTERFEDIKFPTLASPKIAKSINKFSKLQIFGWGLDQNEDLAELLRVSNLTIQDSLATKAFGKYFNPKTMISAGRKIPAENVWSGACSGDSGGPLLSEINSINVIVGITSWGAKNCVPNKPSIFARVSYYEADIKNGIKALETQSKVVDRSAPVATIEPALIGQAKPGSTLKCSAGSWKNALAITSTWISPARINGSTNADVLVQASDGSSVFKCEVIISSAKASVRRVLTTSITGSAVTTSNPVISGIPSSVVKSGTIARCEGWNWRSPVDSERITWFTSSSSQPTVPVNGRQIGSGSSITLDSSLLRGENGRYLICQVTGVKDGFESHYIASKYLTTASAPTISYVSISAYSLTSGSSATCSFTSYSDVESTRIDWGYTSVSGFFTQYSGLTGEQIQLTRDLVQQAAGKYLACRVTLSNSGGEVSKSANTYNTFASLPSAPNVSASISGSIVAGSIARCSADSGSNYGSNLSYAWGKTSSSGSRIIEGQVYSRSTSYALTSSSLDELSGAFLTCVVTLENTVGSVSSASSISIPNNKTTVPQPTSPSVEAQTASSASITVKIRVPSISGYDSSKMIAKLNVVNTSNCINLNVTPGSLYDCSGLSANTTYTANISVASTSGVIVTNISPNISFTTIGLGSSLYVCGQSCSGTLTSSVMQYYISDKRAIEANAESGGPITSSTCTGSGCNPGTAPALPVACSTGSYERTNITANATAQITTHFRYCSAPTDTTPPAISSGTLARTGYAPIIPTSGAAGASISVRFIATDNIGIANTSVRLINPENVVVATSSGSFIGGGVSDGVYSATIATASSGPRGGNVYQIQVQASDGSGNSSSWFNLGTYTIASQVLLPTFGAPQISSVAATSVVVIQPARPSNWLSSYEVIAEVYSSDERTRIGASSEGSYYSPGMTQSVSANNPGGIAPGNTYKVRFALRDTILNRYTYGPFTTFTTPAAVVAPEVVINSGTLTSGVLAGSIAPGGSFGISWRVINNDQISSTVALIDGNGNSASFVGGALVSGTVQDGTYQGSLSVPAGFTAGRYLICAIAISSTNKRSASQCGSRSEYVKVAELQVNTAWTPPADSSTPIYDDTYTRICLTQNWTACGSWTIHDAAGTVVNRLVGPVPFTFCQTSGVNVCSGTPKGYAVLVGRYYAPTPVVAGLQAIAIPEGVPSNSVKIGSNVMASFRATDGLGIANAWVRVWKSTENSLQGFGEGTYTANLISGTNIDGTYQATIVTTIPGYAQGGTFTVGVQIGGNNRITGWIAIGSFTLVP